MRWLLLIALLLLFIPYAEARRRSSGGSYAPVRPHVRRNGSYVQPHLRTTPDSSRQNNWSAQGNVNPFTGKKGSRNPW